MNKQKLFSGFLQSRAFLTAKEVSLQVLFPRVCPMCGKILNLPPKWTGIFLPEEKNNQSLYLDRRKIPSICLPNFEAFQTSDFQEQLSFFRSAMICSDCLKVLHLVPEPRCIRCSRPLNFGEELYCDLCRKKQRVFDGGSALLLHDDRAKKILYDLKFGNKKDNADLLGLEMALRFSELISLWQAEAFLPVPLHKKRLRERGFNQAQLLAEKISFWMEKLFRLPLPVDSAFLFRSKNTKPQRTLEASMRGENVGKAFTVSPGARPYHSVVLVDDIFTSGATIDACAGALKAAGIRRVYFLTASIV